MKINNRVIAIAITIILCFSLNQAALNGLSNSVQQDSSSFLAEEQSIKKAPGGVLVDFDDLGNYVNIYSHYVDVTFSDGYLTWDSTANPYYYPLSSPNVAFSNELNNNITFFNHVSYVSLYITQVFDYNMKVVAYTSTDSVIDSVDVAVNATHQFIEFDIPSGIIHRISVIGEPGFNDHWVIDNLFYLEYVPTTHRTINFDDFEVGTIEDSYPDLLFSSGYLTINTSLNPGYPPESGDMIAYSLEINNWFIFEIPVQQVGFFISTAGIDYEIVLTAYTDQNIIIEEIPIIDNTPNQYIEFNSPLGRINNISVSGITGFPNHWGIDTLSFSILDSPTPNLIDFEDLSDFEIVDGNYPGISFSPGFQAWDSSASGLWPPHSGINVIFTHELKPNVTFLFPVDYVSFYICVNGDYNVKIQAYSESGILLQQVYVNAHAKNQYIVLRSLLGMIHNITLVGDSGFENQWTMDDLCYLEHIPGNNELLTFDEITSGTYIGSLYGSVNFGPGFQALNTSTNIYHPPLSGDNIFYSDQANDNITFANPKSYVSFYVNAFSDYNIEIRVFNEDDIHIQTTYILPDVIHQFVELYSVGGFIKRIQVIGDTGYQNFISFDNLYFEEYKETFEFLLDFEDQPEFIYMESYPHVIFSGGYEAWNSVGSPYYPPNSGNNVAYSHELGPTITFTIPIMYTSFLICTPLDYGIDVLAYSSDDTLIFKASVEPDSIDKLIEIYSEDSQINKIRLNGTSGYETYWTIDNLYYTADIFTYDPDGDGLPYYRR
jgi:hypothetical protein